MCTEHRPKIVATSWQSELVPSTIRRPWQVFAEHLEDMLHPEFFRADDPLLGPAAVLIRPEHFLEYLNRLNSRVQAEGSLTVFLSLPVKTQQEFAVVSLQELSGFSSWRRNLVNHLRGSSEADVSENFIKYWNLLPLDDKAENVPWEPLQTLDEDPLQCWASLLPCDGPPSCMARPKRSKWKEGVIKVGRTRRPSWATGVLKVKTSRWRLHGKQADPQRDR